MQKFGLSHVKWGDIEIHGIVASQEPKRKRIKTNGVAKPQDLEEEPEPIKHKIEHLTSLMKLSDVELVDELFPDKTDMEETA